MLGCAYVITTTTQRVLRIGLMFRRLAWSWFLCLHQPWSTWFADTGRWTPGSLTSSPTNLLVQTQSAPLWVSWKEIDTSDLHRMTSEFFTRHFVYHMQNGNIWLTNFPRLSQGMSLTWTHPSSHPWWLWMSRWSSESSRWARLFSQMWQLDERERVRMIGCW